MDVIFTHGAGLDVPKKTVRACRVPPAPTGRQPDGLLEVRVFGTLTRDLLAWSDWLAAWGIPRGAIESTGESWKPVYHILAGECTVFLVNAAHVTQVPGRETDKREARWLARLRRYGLLPASFIPPQGQRDRRDLTRYRTNLGQERTREVNRVQGVLERANIKLAAVATAVMGVSGRAIVAALVEGQADPAAMAELAKGRRRSKMPRLEQALTGLGRGQQRQLLALPLAHLDVLAEQIDPLSAEIRQCLPALGPGAPLATPGETASSTGSMADTQTPPPPMAFARAVTRLDTMAGGISAGGSCWHRNGASTWGALRPRPGGRPGVGGRRAPRRGPGSGARGRRGRAIEPCAQG